MPAPLFKNIDCLMFNVRDLTAAIAFYHDRLGLPLAWRDGNSAAFQVGESELVVHAGEPKEPETDILVDSADEAARRFVEAGGKILAGPFDIRIGRCVVVQDPWANTLVLLDCTKGVLKTDANGWVIP